MVLMSVGFGKNKTLKVHHCARVCAPETPSNNTLEVRLLDHFVKERQKSHDFILAGIIDKLQSHQ